MTKAVTLGDLSKQIKVDAYGEILDLKNTVNGMVVRFIVILQELIVLLDYEHLRLKSSGPLWK